MGQFLCKLYKQKEVRVLMQGLDAAGKTTILYQMKLGEVVTTIPTIGFNVETVKRRNITLTAWDVGGRDKIRPLFRHYYQNTQGIMFVIDSADPERLEQISDEILAALKEEELRDAVVLILANKQDLKSALSVEQVKEGINFDKLKADNKARKMKIFGCSAVTVEGQNDLSEALDWLCEELAPQSTGWWSQPIRTGTKGHGSSEKTSVTGEDDVEVKTKGGVSRERVEYHKEMGEDYKGKSGGWTFGSYVKNSVTYLKKVVPTLW